MVVVAKLIEFGRSGCGGGLGLDFFTGMGGGEFAVGVVGDLGGGGVDHLCSGSFVGCSDEERRW